MRIDILSLFPRMFTGFLDSGPLNRVIGEGRLEVNLYSLSDWASPEPAVECSGGSKVLRAEPILKCIAAIESRADVPGHTILLSPRGRMFNRSIAKELASHSRLLLLCGRYGGFEDRLHDKLICDELSIGDYILSGGESAAMVVLDTLVPIVTMNRTLAGELNS